MTANIVIDNSTPELITKNFHDTKFQTPQAFLEQARNLYTNGAFDAAIKACTKAIDLDEKLIDAYALRAQFNLELNEHEDAYSDYKKYISLKPTDVNGYMGLARTLRLLGEKDKSYYSEAINYLSEEIIDSPNEKLLIVRVLLCLQSLQYENVIEDLDYLLKKIANSQSPTYAFLFFLRGFTKFLKGKDEQIYQEANSDFEQAIKYSATGRVILYYHGLVFYITGQYDQAKEYLRKALKEPEGFLFKDLDNMWLSWLLDILNLGVDSITIHQALGDISFELNEYNESIQAYSSGLQLPLNNIEKAELYESLGDVFGKMCCFEKARANYLLASEIDRNIPDIYFKLANASQKVGRHQEAIFYFDQQLAIVQGHLPTIVGKIISNTKLGKYKEAELDAFNIYQAKHSSHQYLCAIGFIKYALGVHLGAKAAFEKAFEIDVKNEKIDTENIHYAYAHVNLVLADYSKAIEYYVKVYTANPYFISAHYHEALAFQLAEDLYSAIEKYNVFIKRAEELNMKAAKGYLQRGICHYLLANANAGETNIEEMNLAKQDIEKAYALNQASPEACYYMGLLIESSQETKAEGKAFFYFKSAYQAAQKDRASIKSHFILAKLYEEKRCHLDNAAEVLKHYTIVARSNSKHPVMKQIAKEKAAALALTAPVTPRVYRATKPKNYRPSGLWKSATLADLIKEQEQAQEQKTKDPILDNNVNNGSVEQSRQYVVS